MCQRGNSPFGNLKIQKEYKLIAFLKTLQRLNTGMTEKSSLGPGKQMSKTWFGLET
jgi:hypothetical protein